MVIIRNKGCRVNFSKVYDELLAFRGVFVIFTIYLQRVVTLFTPNVVHGRQLPFSLKILDNLENIKKIKFIFDKYPIHLFFRLGGVVLT